MVVINTREETLTAFGKNMFSTLLLGFWVRTLRCNGCQNYNQQGQLKIGVHCRTYVYCLYCNRKTI